MRRGDERGFSLLLTALVLPVLVLFAGLGMGGAIVRSTADETQRSAELSALAAAVSLPNLGRPNDVTGVPAPPVSYPGPLPPSVSSPPVSPCTGGTSPFPATSGYYQIDASSDCTDRKIEARLGTGPISSLDNLFGTWHQGCDVAQAQYATNRARMSRNFAVTAAGTPKTPLCPNATTGVFDPTRPERIYIRPEMESSGEYELQKCLVQAVGCFNSLTTSSRQELSMIGGKFNDVMSHVPDRAVPAAPSSCVVNPTADGCALSQAELTKTLSDANVPNAAAVAAAVSGTYPSQISDLAGPAYAKLATGLDTAQNTYSAIGGPNPSALAAIFASLFATTSGGMCSISLGPASGQSLCSSGVNLASMLPTTMSPRVRSIIDHAINVPLAPSFGNFVGEGDFGFVEQALARRTFKNAVVVPTIPKQLVVPTQLGANACYTGATAAEAAAATGLSWTINSLSASLQAATGGGGGAAVDSCGNAEIDNTTVDPVTCRDGSPLVTAAGRKAACRISSRLSAIIDTINNAPAATQRALISTAGGVNEQANRAVNAIVAQQLQLEDPGHSYDPRDCLNKDASGNPQTPATWCVDVAGQQVRDMQDFFGSPPDGSAPSFNDVLASAANSGEPISIMGLSSTVDLCSTAVAGATSGNICAAINSALSASLGRSLTPAETVSTLPMVIPALDVVPVYVHQDNTAPGGYSFEEIPDSSQTPGLYRAVLLDPNEAPPLCANSSVSPAPRVTTCTMQATAINVAPLPTTTTTITLPITTTTTAPASTTTTTTTLPITTTTTIPITTTSTTIKLFP